MKIKKRVIFVNTFIILFILYTCISIRGEYLQIVGIGEKYVEIFKHNLEQRIYVFFVGFAVIYLLTYITTAFIKKGLRKFFIEEKKEMPKLPNKSISLAFGAIAGLIFSGLITEKAILAFNRTFFEVSEPVFNLDISYYVFIKPFIEAILYSIIAVMAIMCVYITIYYLISFHKFFEKGINIETLRKSTFIKQIVAYIFFIILVISALAIIMVQDIVLGKFSQTNNGTSLYGAGFVDVTIKKWGYIIFSAFIVICGITALIKARKGQYKKACYTVVLIPIYLVGLFFVILSTNIIYVNHNELDKQKSYVKTNIEYTKKAYDINIDEINLKDAGTITAEDLANNAEVIDNINIFNRTRVLSHLEEYQTSLGFYTFSTTGLGLYDINEVKNLTYITPREIISNETRTYNNKTYEYTHGYGVIITSASETSETGGLKYINSEFTETEENGIEVMQPRIYFGLKTNDIIAINDTDDVEYDYPLTSTTNSYNKYEGQAGLKIGFLDRLILGIKERNIKLAFSSKINKDSSIIIKRNILERVKKVMPYLQYDENPYIVITDEGKLIWVIDAYTTSNSYPYSQVTNLIQDNVTVKKINYIRNSAKILIDSYDGTMKFYITDKTDPIIMAYWNMYPSLFEDLNAEIPEDIAKHFVYPEYLYDIQAEVLKQYHEIQPEVLYRSDDVWDTAKENTSKVTTLVGKEIAPYYTAVKTLDNNEVELGLVLPYTIKEKQNINAYLVGTYNNGKKTLKLYKFNKDAVILGTLQLDTLIEQDEKISAELKAIEVMGTKIEKNIIVIPVDNTLLYVQPIFQVLQNENKTAPILKKVIVASGNKVAIGNNVKEALNNLVSQEAVSIKIETDSIEDLIEEIIKANNNLTESNASNDWSLIGKDIEALQNLINQLEKLIEEEKKNEEVVTEPVETVNAE